MRNAFSAPETGKPSAHAFLRGSRIGIGPILPQDVGTIFQWFNDHELARLDFAFRPLDALAYGLWLDTISRDPTKVFFTIRKLGEAQLLGYVFLRDIHAIHRSAELGIRIGRPEERGRGNGKEAIGLLLDYAWGTLNLHRVHLEVLAHNEHARHLYRSLGFQEEGRLRHAAFIGGEWADLIPMAILRPD